jgi:hypothetical protein
MTDPAATGSLNCGRTRPAYHRVVRTLLAGVALATMLLASVAAAAGNPPGVRVIHTKDTIESFAIGGHRIAYYVQGFSGLGCNKIAVLDLRTGKTGRGRGHRACIAGYMGELAIAGKRIAWIVTESGNTSGIDYLNTSSLPRLEKRRLAVAQRFGEPGDERGNWIGHLVASGELLAVNRWSTHESTVVNSKVAVITRTGLRLRRIALSRRAVLGQTADRGRIGVLYGDSSVEIYAANAKRLLRLKLRSSSKEIALRGDYLLVLTETPTLEIYDARTGAYVRSWPVQAKAPAEVDAYGGVAIYVAQPQNTLQSFKIHAVELKTGKDVVVATGTWLGHSAELEPAGLLYARDRHNLVLIPFKNVLGAVS